MEFKKELRASTKNVSLKDIPANGGDDLPKRKDIEAKTAEHIAEIQALQYRLYAEEKQALLIVLQGMDTSGKDGTIRKTLGAINPQGCEVTSFKKPTDEELGHDFLWRIHKACPSRGMIGVFNRSHYEDVLIVRVHDLVPKTVWSKRYDLINDFEQNLVEAGTTIVKINLHIDLDEQKERLQARLDDPIKQWKFNVADLAERKKWDDYQEAYEALLERCSPDHAPWYIVPANRKWYRNYLITGLILETLREMDPQVPPPEDGLENVVID